ncbi:acyltransferase [Candidatus Poribacteria bacterium]|nr:acyltransferase [Candidatus Poribacteria bacterium]
MELFMELKRNNDIDWLRVLAMLMIFLFHCARFFDDDGWHVKNNQLNVGMSVLVNFVAQWIMPLFFILSGKSTYFSLTFRKGGQYLQERFKRLVIPLVFGIVVHIPLQVYIERVSQAQFVGSFIEFYPHYFDGFYGFGGNFAWMGLHLWYLEMLFIFSLMTLPLFIYLRKQHRFTSRVAVFFNQPGAIFLLAVPIALMELLVNLQPDGIGRRDFGGWSLAVYIIFFIYGYLITIDLNFKQTIEKHRIIALAMGVIASTIGYFLVEAGVSSREYYFAFLRGFNSWFWLVAILGFGGKYLNFSNRVLRYANEAVLPFYVLHQTIIVTIGFYIASWNASVLVKYLIISTASFAAIMVLYNLAIKRINLLRLLFGLKQLTK